MPAPLTDSHIKHHLRAMLSRRLFLRFHVTLLLFWTFGVALLTTKGLLLLGVQSMLVRYPLAVLLAWLGFLGGVRVWLWYAGFHGRGASNVNDLVNFDLTDLDVGELSSITRKAGGAFRGGGGSFGGGGASADFTVGHVAAEVSHGNEGAAGALADSASEAVGAVFDGASSADEGAVPLLVLALVLGALAFLFVGVVYSLLGGPEILVEALFQALLAGGLLRKVRRTGPGDWAGAVLRLTWKPALATLCIATGFALAVGHWMPQVHSLTQLLAVMLTPAT